jgi:hypothetical protein
MMTLTKRFLLPAFLLLTLTVACSSRDGHLIPLDPGNGEETILAGQPQLVTFSQLQADPDAFRDRLIRVSGSLLKAGPPPCLPYSGPAAEWALIAEELRLDATGFEQAVSMLDSGLPMTVDGFFRLYEGALGCGKAAPDGSTWTLEVLKVVQPNPIVAAGPRRQTGEVTSLPASPVAPVIEPVVSATPAGPATMSPNATPDLTSVATSTAPGQSIPTATATPIPGAVTRTPIPTASNTPAATSRFTATPTFTPLPGTPPSAPTPTPTTTPVPGLTPTRTPTATIGPYPGSGTPTATATATPTVQGYPAEPTTTPGYP